MLVTIERHRLTVLLEVATGRLEVVERRFRRKAQLLQAARRVIDVDQQRAAWAALFEPLVVRTGSNQPHRRRPQLRWQTPIAHRSADGPVFKEQGVTVNELLALLMAGG
jgi:hypothetical protein